MSRMAQDVAVVDLLVMTDQQDWRRGQMALLLRSFSPNPRHIDSADFPVHRPPVLANCVVVRVSPAYAERVLRHGNIHLPHREPWPVRRWSHGIAPTEADLVAAEDEASQQFGFLGPNRGVSALGALPDGLLWRIGARGGMELMAMMAR